MPIKDPERKKEVMKAWRQRVMPQGYGKWLYERRKLRFNDADRFRTVLERISRLEPGDDVLSAVTWAQEALEESRRAEEQLGPWVAPTEEEQTTDE